MHRLNAQERRRRLRDCEFKSLREEMERIMEDPRIGVLLKEANERLSDTFNHLADVDVIKKAE